MTTLHTVCSRSSDPIYVITYYINGSLLLGNIVQGFVRSIHISEILKLLESSIQNTSADHGWKIYILIVLYVHSVQNTVFHGPANTPDNHWSSNKI